MSPQDAFDAIIEEMRGIEPGISRFEGQFTHERSPENGNLTAALFAVKMLGADGLRAFYEKGGRFTDQYDAEGRDAGLILRERWRDALRQQSLQAQRELRENLTVFQELVAKQGGLIHVEETYHPPNRSLLLRASSLLLLPLNSRPNPTKGLLRNLTNRFGIKWKSWE